eukprot:gene591-2475_t
MGAVPAPDLVPAVGTDAARYSPGRSTLLYTGTQSPDRAVPAMRSTQFLQAGGAHLHPSGIMMPPSPNHAGPGDAQSDQLMPDNGAHLHPSRSLPVPLPVRSPNTLHAITLAPTSAPVETSWRHPPNSTPPPSLSRPRLSAMAVVPDVPDTTRTTPPSSRSEKNHSFGVHEPGRGGTLPASSVLLQQQFCAHHSHHNSMHQFAPSVNAEKLGMLQALERQRAEKSELSSQISQLLGQHLSPRHGGTDLMRAQPVQDFLPPLRFLQPMSPSYNSTALESALSGDFHLTNTVPSDSGPGFNPLAAPPPSAALPVRDQTRAELGSFSAWDWNGYAE